MTSHDPHLPPRPLFQATHSYTLCGFYYVHTACLRWRVLYTSCISQSYLLPAFSWAVLHNLLRGGLTFWNFSVIYILSHGWLITSIQSSSDGLNTQRISSLPLEQWPSAFHLFMLPVSSFIVPSTLSLFVRHRHSFVAILWRSESRFHDARVCDPSRQRLYCKR